MQIKKLNCLIPAKRVNTLKSATAEKTRKKKPNPTRRIRRPPVAKAERVVEERLEAHSIEQKVKEPLQRPRRRAVTATAPNSAATSRTRR